MFPAAAEPFLLKRKGAKHAKPAEVEFNTVSLGVLSVLGGFAFPW
jgi:hypothetical protein